jgi:AcrR family transcriptional regulator
MNELLSKVSIQLNENIYLKDPESSDLGRKILNGGIDMIYEHGFDNFTFRKLGKEIRSTEASIYRYFENKNKLLLYLTSWYWGWMEYKLVFSLANVSSPESRLEKAVQILTQVVKADESFSHVNVEKLNNIVISDSSKAYLNKEVDDENKAGVFLGYKQLVARVSDIILEVNTDYKYPHMLISTVIEGAHFQRYFAEHLPRLTDVVVNEDAITEFYKKLVSKAIQC